MEGVLELNGLDDMIRNARDHLAGFKSDLEGIQRIVAGAKPQSADDGESKKEREAIGVVNKARRALGRSLY